MTARKGGNLAQLFLGIASYCSFNIAVDQQNAPTNLCPCVESTLVQFTIHEHSRCAYRLKTCPSPHPSPVSSQAGRRSDPTRKKSRLLQQLACCHSKPPLSQIETLNCIPLLPSWLSTQVKSRGRRDGGSVVHRNTQDTKYSTCTSLNSSCKPSFHVTSASLSILDFKSRVGCLSRGSTVLAQNRLSVTALLQRCICH